MDTNSHDNKQTITQRNKMNNKLTMLKTVLITVAATLWITMKSLLAMGDTGDMMGLILIYKTIGTLVLIASIIISIVMFSKKQKAERAEEEK